MNNYDQWKTDPEYGKRRFNSPLTKISNPDPDITEALRRFLRETKPPKS